MNKLVSTPFACLVLLSFVFGCSNSDDEIPLRLAEPDIHISGFEYDGTRNVIKFWENGNSQTLGFGEAIQCRLGKGK